jgi:DNA polymerase-3 subunit alpha
MALLDAMDRIMSISASHFKAADSGQMSLFGPQTGLVQAIELPPSTTDVTRREQLNWERDLIGLYVSDHPLSPVMDAIRQNISHTAAELVEAQHQQVVRVAGLVTRIRHHTTKRGEPMAFATIEDYQGNIDLVIFPRTYAKFQDLIQWDNIIMVDGKVDARGSEPKVLADRITSELDQVVPLEVLERQKGAPSRKPRTAAMKSGSGPNDGQTSKESASTHKTEPAGTSEAGDTEAGKAQPTPVTKWEAEDPPPPDAFPFGWDETNGIEFRSDSQKVEPDAPADKSTAEGSEPVRVAESLRVEPVLVEEQSDPAENDLSDSQGENPETLPASEEGGQDAQPAAQVEAEMIPAQTGDQKPEPAVLPGPKPQEKILQPIVPPLRSESAENIHMITVILRPCADKVRDKLLLRRIFGIMISYPGEDRFAFHIFERGRGHLLEFPNLTTGLCPELTARLQELVGADNLRVEPITFQ